MPECTCDMKQPKHSGVVTGSTHGKYAIYLDSWEDESVIDPNCYYHGDNGVNVLTLKATHNA